MKPARFVPRSLKTRITVATLVIFVAGIWALSLYVNAVLHRETERQLSDQQFATVSMLARSLNERLLEREYALDAAGQLISRAADDPAALREALSQRPTLQFLFNGGLLAFDMKGQAVAAYPARDAANTAPQDPELVAAVLRDQRGHIGRPLAGSAAREPTFLIAAPIRTPGGVPKGVLAGVIDLSQPDLFDPIVKSRIGRTGGYLIIDPRLRRVIAATDARRTMEQLPPPGKNLLIDRFLNGYQGSSIIVNPLGVEVLASDVTIPAAGWIVAATISTEEAFATPHALNRQILFATIALTALSGLIVWWYLRRELRPIARAAGTLVAMAHGSLPLAPVPVSRRDELGALIESFNRLVETIQAREAALRENDASLRSILDTTLDGYWKIDANGRLLDVNPAYCRLSGYTREELISKHLSEIDAQEDAAAVGQRVATLVATQHMQFESEHRRKDGQLWPVEVSASYHDGGGGQIHAFVRDIRARRTLLRTLQSSEARYRAAFNQAAVGMSILDLSGRWTEVNQRLTELLGYTREEMLQRTFQDLTHPDDLGGDLVHLHDMLSGREESFVSEKRYRRKDGRYVWVLLSVTLVRTPDGRPDYFMSVQQDIDARKRAEQRLLDQHRLLEQVDAHHRHLLQSLDTAIVVHAPDTRIEFSNRRAAELLGLSAEQMQGKQAIDPAWSFVNEAGERMAVDDYPAARVIATRAPLRDLVLGVNPPNDARRRWLLVSAFPNFDDKGALDEVVVNFHDITERKHAETQIWTEANFDHLTHLPNRRLLMDRLGQELKKAQRDHSHVAALFIDLDRFKEVNDTLGHDIGDVLLIEAAQRIRRCLRDYDTLARFGGDEFMVVLSELHDTADIGGVAAKIVDRLSAPFSLMGQDAFVSASIGIALYPEDALTVTDLIKHADQAMYAAKDAGRSTVRYFTRTMQDAAEQRMQLATDLRRALAGGQLELHYQPVVELASGKIHKAEALLRWNHPERGLISPAAFIPIAEDCGAIHEIGDWVFFQAAEQVRRWLALRRDFQISINKSPVQFSTETPGHNHWIETLAHLGLPGACLVVEITEGSLMDGSERVQRSLLNFRDAGIQVAIDDFGTGYSSLAYLKKFDIDYLKIDQSFTRNLAPDAADLALCEAIVVMAHKLGIKVIAEGVETPAQRELLIGIGCDYAQGYLFSQAVPAAAFEQLLQDER